MLDAIYSSISGMHAHQMRLDVVSNNLANVNTAGFKKGRVSFEDLVRAPSPADADRSLNIGRPEIGLGAAVGKSWSEFSQGDLRKTDRALDVAIQGRGFFEVEMPDGSAAYTRMGGLQVNAAGELTTTSGRRLLPAISLPPDALNVTISENGVVSVTVPDESAPVEVGRLELVTFINPAGLTPLGEGMYEATELSGEPYVSEPGTAGAGILQQAFLESSNVDFVEELVELVAAQRAYQLNARALQAADEMLAEINSLRR